MKKVLELLAATARKALLSMFGRVLYMLQAKNEILLYLCTYIFEYLKFTTALHVKVSYVVVIYVQQL